MNHFLQNDYQLIMKFANLPSIRYRVLCKKDLALKKQFLIIIFFSQIQKKEKKILFCEATF